MREPIMVAGDTVEIPSTMYYAGVDQKYGKVFTENPNGITKDEPVFLLVAHDDFSLETLEGWSDEVDFLDQREVPQERYDLLMKGITAVKDAFTRWRAEHSDKCHIPD